MSFDPKRLARFSTGPGVYLMEDAEGLVLYVGKANNLQMRLRQYFQKKGDEREMVPILRAQIASIQTISVENETEALVLESNLIKKHRPKYNVLLKDDKSHICLHVNLDHMWPTLRILRAKDVRRELTKGKKKAARRFGPYPNAHVARGLAEKVYRMFRLRQCSDSELKRRERPCILYGMHRCSAPCVGHITEEAYAKDVEKAMQFLSGKRANALKHLKKEIERASELLEFERAAILLKQMEQLESAEKKTRVSGFSQINRDVIGFYQLGKKALIVRMTFREGRLLGMDEHMIAQCVMTEKEALEAFIMQTYSSANEVDELIVSGLASSKKALEAFLFKISAKRLKILTPTRGEKFKALQLAERNAKDAFERADKLDEALDEALCDLAKALNLKDPPEIIECIDQSHLAGSEMVSGVVRYVKGKKETKGYRSYRIRTAKESDDYGALKEALTRHLKKLPYENLPNLLIIDGGRGHLNAALQVIDELNIASISVIGCSKEDSRHDKGLSRETVHLASTKEPIYLDPKSSALHLLQRIRDEAHRYAITFQKKRRSKELIRSQLDLIPGIGPTKKKRLLSHFGSVAKISSATDAELLQVEGIHKKDVEKIRDYLDG
jgi:excinuclease ABC subunit C